MIKINLLGVAPPPSKMPSVGGPPAPIITLVVMFLGALIICFGIVGGLWKFWSGRIADLQTARSREKTRQAALAGVEAQNVKYKQLEDALLSRINTIDALKSGRVGPVELMSSLGNVVDQTNDVYLYTVSPVGGRLQLKGQSGTVDSMATFLASLKNSGSFDDVQLEQFYEDDQHERLGYKFTLNCLFKSPTAGTTPAAGAAPAGPGGPVGQPSVPAQVQRGLKRGS